MRECAGPDRRRDDVKARRIDVSGRQGQCAEELGGHYVTTVLTHRCDGGGSESSVNSPRTACRANADVETCRARPSAVTTAVVETRAVPSADDDVSVSDETGVLIKDKRRLACTRPFPLGVRCDGPCRAVDETCGRAWCRTGRQVSRDTVEACVVVVRT